jgi:multicomponent Na+:H+ antiporter subunit A
MFGAPDLAMTQFLIESLTVILFVLALYHLPQFSRISSNRTRLRDLMISAVVGALATLLVLSAAGTQLQPKISDFFVERSLPEAHGRNVVNVILVDFRGFDTFGETTVLAIAAAGVVALLKMRPVKVTQPATEEESNALVAVDVRTGRIQPGERRSDHG